MPVALLPLIIGATIVAAQQPSRSITFKNSCPRDVWVVGTSGATGNCADGCQQGSVCNNDNGLCFFEIPTPSNGYRVKAGGDTSFEFPAWQNDNGAAWSGNFGGCMQGTLCTANGRIADEATCDAQGCSSFHVGSLAEITMGKKSVDFYDVSNIGGLAVPMSFEPTNPHPRAEDPYFCANLGGLTSKTGLGPSSWKFDVPDVKYKWVIANSDAPTCSSDADCNGSTCGLSLDQQDQVTFRVQCGQHAGYWTQGAICAGNSGSQIMPCQDSFQNGPMQATVSRLQGCTGDAVTGSCYTEVPTPDTACCGCVDWQDEFGAELVPNTTRRCQNKNPIWKDRIQPTLEWLKRGAPNAYTYPYDDVSSTSTCDDMQGDWNAQNYIVELCPGGVYWNVDPAPQPDQPEPSPEPSTAPEPSPNTPEPTQQPTPEPSSEPVPQPSSEPTPQPSSEPSEPSPSPSPSPSPPKSCPASKKRAVRKARKAKREAEEIAAAKVKKSNLITRHRHHARHAPHL